MASSATGQRSASPQEKAMGVSGASSGGSFAFLVHSQDTLNNNLPPNVDNQPLARQKRRRTRYAPMMLLNELEADLKLS